MAGEKNSSPAAASELHTVQAEARRRDHLTQRVLSDKKIKVGLHWGRKSEDAVSKNQNFTHFLLKVAFCDMTLSGGFNLYIQIAS